MLASAEGQNTLFVFSNDHTGLSSEALAGIPWPHIPSHALALHGIFLLPCPGIVNDPGTEKPLRQNQQLVK